MPNNDAIFSLTQALQLVGLVPCLFIVLFLASLSGRNHQVILPAAYFLSLACTFALPIVGIFFPDTPAPRLTGGLLAGESMLAALSFLMILQFVSGRIPPLPYWLMLAIPLMGGSILFYSSLTQEAGIASLRALYNILSSALIFLLLIYFLSRFPKLAADEIERKHKYALVISLISLHLLVLAVDLAQLSGNITALQAQSIETVLRLTFIYLVITSLFRVFYPTLVPHVGPLAKPYDPNQDLPHVAALRKLLDEGVHREMRLNRAALAKKMGIGEHHLSRVINHHFKMSFNELINGYRIEDAKRRLKEEAVPVTTIAFAVGFNSIASFNRVFKEQVGMSPTEFRFLPLKGGG